MLAPLEHVDLLGLDLIRTAQAYLLTDLARNTKPGRLLEDKVKTGGLKANSGGGFYEWTHRDPSALIERRDRHIVRELKRLCQERPQLTSQNG